MKKAKLLPLIAALLAPLPANAESLVHQASQLIKEGKTQQAMELFTNAAESGDPAGEYGLGVLYFQGTGVDKDIAVCTQHFQKAAGQGHVMAQYNLGNAYLHGRGVEKDLDQAERWWREASVAGYVRAQYNLGVLLQENAQATELQEEGIAWLRASAERGFSKAMEKLQALDEPLMLEHSDNDYERSILRSEARLLTLPPDTYSIQLFSGLRSNSAENFIAKYHLQDQALRFRFPGKKGLWTGVLYGLYPNGAEAQQTITELKERLKDAGPWLRSLSEIQAQIRAAWKKYGAADSAAVE